LEELLKRIIKDYLILAIIVGTIIGLDQWSKIAVRNNLALGETWVPWDWLAPYARVVHWYNTGVAFGMFQNQNTLFAILAVIVALAIIYIYPSVPSEDWSLRLAMAMQLGGAGGNLVDRLTIGHVTDWFSVGKFPVFNIADSCVSVGVGVLLLGVWLQERKNKAENAAKSNLFPIVDTPLEEEGTH
jgi:signal peptidase II